MDFTITPTSGLGSLTLEKATDIRSDIYNSLNIKKGSFFQNRNFGNDMFRIKKVTAQNLNLAKQYIQEALAWLLQVGRAKTIDVIVEADSADINRINVKVTATQPDGLIVTYSEWVYVASNINIHIP
jgi:phage gp46-like protein